MSQSIVTQSGTKRLLLASGQAFRQPVYGSSWTKMRIGIRYCVPGGGSIVGTPQLVFGMASGNTNGFGSSTTDNFIGVRTTTGTWTQSGTSGNLRYESISHKLCTRIGSTLTDHASAITSTNIINAEHDKRCFILLQIEKGSPNYTIRMVVSNNTSTASHDVTDSELEQFMDLDDALTSPGTIVSGYTTVATNNTIAMDEVGGSLDHIHLYWDKISVGWEIDDVAHRLIAA